MKEIGWNANILSTCIDLSHRYKYHTSSTYHVRDTGTAMTLTEAEELAREASSVTRHIRQQIDAEKRAIEAKYQAMIDADCEAVDNMHDAVLKDAATKEREAHRLRDELKIASMEEATLGGVPVGGRVVKWDKSYSFTAWRKTGLIGIVELCTPEAKFPDNQRWTLPSVGELFVRVLKKDDTPSLRIGGRSSMGLPWGWYPEGVTPK